MTEAEEQTQYFETARGLMELATGAGEADRGPLERCAVRYFWKACGMTQTAWDARPGSHTCGPGGGGRDAHNARQAGLE